MDTIRSIYFWAMGMFLTVLLYLRSLWAVIVYPDDKKRLRVHEQWQWWGNALVGLGRRWELKITGLENIDKNRTYVIVANHESIADILIMYKTGLQFKWVSKEDLFRVPFLGWAGTLARYIELERGDFSSIKKIYREAAMWLKDGVSVAFFPEGTRSRTGEMGEFQNGAFKLAIKEKAPVLPIAIVGTRDVVPSGGRQFNPGKVKPSFNILRPVETGGFSQGDFGKLRDIVRHAIEEGRAANRSKE